MTAKELAAKYPTGGKDAVHTWIRVLEKFRNDDKLREGEHYRYVNVGNCKPARAYSEKAVLTICYNMGRKQDAMPFYRKLWQDHHVAIKAVLQPVTPVKPE